MIVVMASMVVSVLLRAETSENAQKTDISRKLGKNIWGQGWQTGSAGSSETQVFFLGFFCLNKLYGLTNETKILGSIVV